MFLYLYKAESLELRLEATRSPSTNRHGRRQYEKYDKLLPVINIRSNPLKKKKKKECEIEYQIKKNEGLDPTGS